MVSAEDKKKQKLLELGLDPEKYPELTDFLDKNWTALQSIIKNKRSKDLIDYIIPNFFSLGWIKNSSDLKNTANIGYLLLTITEKHFGDREYDPKQVFNFEFMSTSIKSISDWKLIISILNQSESPFDLFQNGLKSLFSSGIISSSKDLENVKKITKSAGHNANSIFVSCVPILIKYRVMTSIKDLENLMRPILDICCSVKYPENVLRDLETFGEKNILRDKGDLEMIRDVLKTEKDEWKSQQKFYQILNLVNSGKIRFSVDLKKYLSK